MARWAPAPMDVIGEYADEVLELFPRGRVLVGIDGIDGAGKATFARELGAAIRDRGVASAVVSLDAFHAAREVRHQGADDARTWYANAYDYEAFRRLVVEPLPGRDAGRARAPVPGGRLGARCPGGVPTAGSRRAGRGGGVPASQGARRAVAHERLARRSAGGRPRSHG